MKDTSAAAPES